MKKCCLGCFIAILVIVIACGVCCAVILNSTPLKLGISETNIAGDVSLSDLGLEDKKLIDLVKGLVSLNEFEDSQVVTNPYLSSEGNKAKTNLEKSSIYKDGEVQYYALAVGKATYIQRYLYEYNDTTLAYILDSAINTSLPSVNFGVNDASVKEVSITNLSDRGHAKIVLSIPFQTESELNVFKIDHVLFTVEFNFVITTSGEIATISSSVEEEFVPQLTINDGNIIITAVIEHQLNKALEGGVSTVATKTVNAFVKVLNNLGQVGTADVNSEKVVKGNDKLGIDGVKNGSITFITHLEE